MDFTTIGSIGMFARTMKMQFQWQEKSRTGNYAAKDSNKTKAEKSEKDVQLDLLKKQLDEMRDNSDDKMCIRDRLYTVVLSCYVYLMYNIYNIFDGIAGKTYRNIRIHKGITVLSSSK